MQQKAAEQSRRGLTEEETNHPANSSHTSGRLPVACCPTAEGDYGTVQSEITSSCDAPPHDQPFDAGDRTQGLTAMPLLRSYGGLPSSIWSNTDHAFRQPVKPEPTNRTEISSVFPPVASAFSGWKPQLTSTPSQTVQIVQSKLTWAAEQLRSTSSVDNSIQLCQLIKSCAETLVALQTMQERCNKMAESTQM